MVGGDVGVPWTVASWDVVGVQLHVQSSLWCIIGRTGYFH
jgi:hypothetical protein